MNISIKELQDNIYKLDSIISHIEFGLKEAKRHKLDTISTSLGRSREITIQLHEIKKVLDSVKKWGKVVDNPNEMLDKKFSKLL